jgi:hypothetical protein
MKVKLSMILIFGCRKCWKSQNAKPNFVLCQALEAEIENGKLEYEIDLLAPMIGY